MSTPQEVTVPAARRQRVLREDPLVLCCGTQGCPQVHVDTSLGLITITDDDNGVVTLSVEEWKMAVEKVKI